jgi:alginate O-acetyltransferase complex protein AlgI
MLFSSFIFLFGFLPAALAGFWIAGRFGRTVAASWLVVASLVFYGWWEPRFLVVLLGSILFNYGAAAAIRRLEGAARRQGLVLTLAVCANLLALVYYKYLFSILEFLRSTGIADVPFAPVLLPLGISFFTFTQIGYLLDVKQGVSKVSTPLDYLLFVTFFPHLIAGPILHNREMMPQYADPGRFKFDAVNMAVGLSIFTIGLVKKTVLADPVSSVVAPGFADPGALGLIGAWHVALSYSLQLYFDFSGYSDMAIGLARMFNIRFPLNFNSPYKSASIIEYWQRWHMTLTRYLTLYLYNPIALSATRRRVARGLPITRKAYATPSGFMSMVAIPTFVTMGLAGVWHGAGVQFVVFGLLHATYLIVNHASRILRPGKGKLPDGLLRHAGKVALTYLAVLVAAVFFRAPSCGAALDLLAGIAGLHGNGPGMDLPLLPDGAARSLLTALGIVAAPGGASVPSGATVLRAGWIVMLYAVIWLGPNTQQIMRHYSPALERVQPWFLDWPAVRLNPAWAVTLGIGLMLGILATSGTAEFLYFQF